LKGIRLEFLALVPTIFSHCRHCMDLIQEIGLRVHSQQFDEYPEDTKEMLQRISELAEDVMRDFPGVDLRLIDLASPLGFLKGLRHGAGKGAVVLINGRKVFDKIPDYESLKRELIKAGADTGIACLRRAIQK
jgi:hypothetical protein